MTTMTQAPWTAPTSEEAFIDRWGSAAVEAEKLALSLVQQARIFHSTTSKAINAARKDLDDMKLDEAQVWLDAQLQDGLSDAITCIFEAAAEIERPSKYDPDRHSVNVPDFEALSAIARVKNYSDAELSARIDASEEKDMQPWADADFVGPVPVSFETQALKDERNVRRQTAGIREMEEAEGDA